MSHGIRDGEIAVEAPLPHDATLAFVGHVATPWSKSSDCPRQGDRIDGPVCHLVVDPVWGAALEGIDRHGELQVLYWMHRARRDLVRLSPKAGQKAGPFALRAPTRPNPIASSIVTLVARDGLILAVRGLDCLDGTPLLDIKPWRERR